MQEDKNPLYVVLLISLDLLIIRMGFCAKCTIEKGLFSRKITIASHLFDII